MRKPILGILLASAGLFVWLGSEALGRGGRGGGIRGGGGGGVSRPAPQVSRPAPRPAPSRPAPSISRPQPARPTPSINPSPRPVQRPNPPVKTLPSPSLPKVQRPANLPKAGDKGFNLPPNFQRPNVPKQLPAVTLPKSPGGKLDLPKGKIDFPKGKADFPKGGIDKGKIGSGVKEKYPNIGDKKGNLIPGSRPIGKDGPSRGDLNNWLQLPGRGPGNLPRPPGGNFIGGGRTNIIGADRSKTINNRITNAFVKGKSVDVNIRNKNYNNIGVQVNRHWNQNIRRYPPYFRPNWGAFPRPLPGRWWGYGHWYGRYPWNHWWRPATWAACTAWIAGNWARPVYYDYGGDVIVQNNTVYIDGSEVAPAPEYAAQALDLAAVTSPPEETKIEWLPLGTFALVPSPEETEPTALLQLAVSKQGLVSGTYVNVANDKATEIEGQVDPATQRVALRNPEQPDTVLEVGLYNLTQPQTPVMMHFGTLRSQTWYLVRLEEPKEG